ncbi:MAG TPA: hypothetical protein VGD94_06015 [Vicinamibacterales bacterium]
MRNLLVSVQVALSVVVLIGASLQVSSLWKVLQVDPGYTFESGLVIDVDLPERDYRTMRHARDSSILPSSVSRPSPAPPARAP